MNLHPFTIWRLKRKLGLLDIKKHTGVPASSISLWTSGKQGLSYENLVNLFTFIREQDPECDLFCFMQKTFDKKK